MRTICLILCICTTLCASQALSEEKVAVIPYFYSAKNLQNVITVATKGGDYSDPVAALESIKDAAEDNPYLVAIGPGVFELSEALLMKPYVTIRGAGQDVTKITGGFGDIVNGNEGAVVVGADKATLSNLTVENTGPSKGSNRSTAIYNNNSSPTVNNVTAVVSSNSSVTTEGILNTNNSSPLLNSMSIISSGGDYAVGVYNDTSAPAMKDIKININGAWLNCGIVNNSSDLFASDLKVTVYSEESRFNCGLTNDNSTIILQNITINSYGSDSSSHHTGINNHGSPIDMSNVRINVSGGGNNRGISNSSSTLIMDGIAISSTGGTGENVGIIVHDTSTFSIQHSTVEGETSAIVIDEGTGNIVANSSIKGGVSYTGGTETITCLNSDNGIDKELGLDCLEITPSL